MIANEYFKRFQDDTVDKQIRIEFDGGVITNEDFNGQSFELTESLCSESVLRFGSCEASTIKIKVHNIFIPLKGKWLTVSTMLKGMEEPFLIGRYKVYSDIPTADRKYRDVVAYDAMYDIINADVSDWYNEVLPDKEEDTWITMRSFRTSLMRHFGIEQEETELVNDYMKVERTIEPGQMSGRDVITAICEMNGCFGHIGRNGKFQWICLPQAIQGLYPANELYPDHAPDHLPYQQRTGHLYPQEPQGTKIGKGFYIECGYEDFVTKDINKVQIRQEENDIGCIYPNAEPNEDDNCYIIEDNFLVYGKTASALETIAAKIYGKISNISYRPIKSIDAKGNPCFEVGDPIRLVTKYEIIESYILKRTLKGIQALRDNYSADGELEYSEKVNSVQKSIVQLKGKTNTLTRNVEETNSHINDVEAGLSSDITQTAEEIRTEIKNTKEGLESSITQSASQIRMEVTSADQELQSQIMQNAAAIDLRVTKDGVVSAINLSPETITIQAKKIDLKGLVSAEEFTSKFATISTLKATKSELEEVIATKATIKSLNATNATVNELKVEKLSVSEFDVEKATLENLIAQKIDASTVKADYMEVKNWTYAGHIRADKIDAGQIVAEGLRVGTNLVVKRGFAIASGASFSMDNENVGWITVSINDKTYTFLGDIGEG